jgi:mRNA interferase RelE/StbE
MTQYRVEFDRKAEKQLEAIRVKRTVLALRGAILALATDPRPVGVVKLAGAADMWRISVGDWRVIYRIDDGELVVLVVALGVRGGVYR